MSETIKTEVHIKATAALIESVKEELKEEDRDVNIEEIINENSAGNDKRTSPKNDIRTV